MIENEAAIRGIVFFAVLLIMAFWELVAPYRKLSASKVLRWVSNLGIVFLSSALVRWTIPILPVSLAVYCQQNGIGLFNGLQLNTTASIIATVVLFDFLIYLQHVVFHLVPVLWRLHAMHHADVDLDVTSGNRFHPIEIIISVGVKLGAVWLMGPTPFGVFLFEIILNGMAQFNHSNIKLPKSLDQFLRLLIVTPDMHRVHHSVILRETNSNYGFNLPWWDRIFGTYIAQPQKGHLGMEIGLSKYRSGNEQNVLWMILLPFRRKV